MLFKIILNVHCKLPIFKMTLNLKQPNKLHHLILVMTLDQRQHTNIHPVLIKHYIIFNIHINFNKTPAII